jgi:phosphatidylserine/phosphatidylglycerophosphate/cardiolipin synthase-like enzyme
MPERVGNIELYMGPQEVDGPDSLRDAIVDFIDGAERRLDIAVQELDCMEIADAVLAARARGVTVRLVMEGDYLRSTRRRPDPWEPTGPNEQNRLIQNAILRAAVNVRSDFNSSIFHQKFIVRDYQDLLTGSTNFTDTGTSSNLNHLVIVRDKAVAKLYSREYREIQQGHFGKLNEGHDPTPTDVVVSNVGIRVLFAPDHNPEMEIMKQMLKSKERVDFAVFTFSKSSGIDDTLLSLHELGREIHGLVDAAQGSQDWAATKLIHAAGIDVQCVPRQGPLRKLHHKLMVIDRQVVIAGSFNYTGPANQLNDENIIVLGDLEATSQTQRTAQARLAEYALVEIDRIRNTYARPIH